MDIVTSASVNSDILSRAGENLLGGNTHDLQTCLIFFMGGALGAIANLLVRDNALILPRHISGALVMGCIGPMLIGGVVGIIADGSLAVATLSGYVGSSVLDKFIPSSSSQNVEPNNKEEENV